MIRRQFKRMLTLALPLLLAVPAQAQSLRAGEQGPGMQQAETFCPHWYVQPQAGLGWTVGEAKIGKLLSPAASLGVGRQFSPLFGLRAGATGWQARNRQVGPSDKYDWKYVQASLDVTLSLSNLVLGWQAGRRWNAYAFVGGGLNVAFSNDKANELAAVRPALFEKVWDGTLLTPAARGGLGLEYSVSPRVALGLEAGANILPDKWNSKKGIHDNVDWQNNLLVGVRIALGKTTRRVQPVAEPEPQPVQREEPKPAVAREETKPAVVKPVAAEPQPKDVKVYFDFDSSDIKGSETAKLIGLAAYLERNAAATVSVTGYASPEGTDGYNDELSRKRAEAVRQYLTGRGVADSRIRTDHKGAIELGDVNESRSVVCIITSNNK